MEILSLAPFLSPRSHQPIVSSRRSGGTLVKQRHHVVNSIIRYYVLVIFFFFLLLYFRWTIGLAFHTYILFSVVPS